MPDVRRTLVAVLCHMAKALGGFAISRRLTRRRLRILCYHGFAVHDEHERMPLMFMSQATFRKRMQALRRMGFNPISLNEAVSRRDSGRPFDNDVVVTFDDGWLTTLTVAAPVMRELGIPGAVYVTTSHFGTSRIVLDVLVSYALASTQRSQVTIAGTGTAADGVHYVGHLRANGGRDLVAALRKVHGSYPPHRVAGSLLAAFGLDPAGTLAWPAFMLCDADEMRGCEEHGISVQLHTHGHTLPGDSEREAIAAVEENRRLVGQAVGGARQHFCFPSGFYQAWHGEMLEKLGIRSATTCDAGMNTAGDNPLFWRRHLDREDMQPIRFEAEMAGVTELLRLLRRGSRRGSEGSAAY